MKFMSYILLMLTVLFLSGCKGKPTKENEKSEATTITVQTFQTEIIPAPGNTFGYNILKNGKIYIHQPHIPVVSGNKGFKTEAQARKAAEFVISKIEKNIIPPTITAAELDSLGVLD